MPVERSPLVTILPLLIRLTDPAMLPLPPAPPTEIAGATTAAPASAALNPPLPPLPPIDCANRPTESDPLVVTDWSEMSITFPARPPLPPDPPSETDTALSAPIAPENAHPPLPPLPPIDCATAPLDWLPVVMTARLRSASDSMTSPAMPP